MNRTVIFDLDGTLADTSGDLIAACNACFDGQVLDPQADQFWAFRGGRAMLRLALERRTGGVDEAEVERLFPLLLASYSEHIDRHTYLYPGVAEALEMLSADGWKLGVCTNKPEGLAEDLIDRLGLSPRFEVILGVDSLAVCKPDPLHLLETIERSGGTPRRSLMVGDTETDRMAARNAGVKCALVTFGPDGEAVRDLNPEALLSHYCALPALAERLIAAPS